MQYFKNGLFVAIFALFGLGLEAAPIHTIVPTIKSATIAPQGDGIVEIIQGLHRIRVEILVPGLIRLEIRNSDQEVIFGRIVTPQHRRVHVNTNQYDDGVYTLEASSLAGKEVISFTIGGEE